MTPDEVKAKLLAVQAPCLDALRDQLPTLTTSDILALMAHPDVLTDRLQLTFEHDEDELVIARAVMMLAEEIDLRIPARRPA